MTGYDGNVALAHFKEAIKKSCLNSKEAVRSAVQIALANDNEMTDLPKGYETIITFVRNAIARGAPKSWIPGLGLDVACREMGIE